MHYHGGAGLPVQPDRAAGTASCYQEWEGQKKTDRISVANTSKTIPFLHLLSISFAPKQLKLIDPVTRLLY